MPTRSPQSPLNRRALIQVAAGAASGAVLGALPAAAAAQTSTPPPAAAPAAGRAPAFDPVQLYRKLHFRSDAGLVWWWLQGPKYGQVGTTLTPLFSMLVGTLQRVTPRDDGGFDLTALEMVFLADPDSGARLTQWRNPYTGETIPVKFAPLGPSTVRYRADNTRVLPTEIGGARLESSASTSAPLVVGDDVFVRDTSTARVFTPGRTTPFEVNDLSTYHGSLRNLVDPKVTMGAATVSFAEVTGWQRWMNMADRPGNLTSRSSGAKVASFAAMPANWRAMLAEVAPQIAANPVAALDGPAARFDR
jgi:hypothetical protein